MTDQKPFSPEEMFRRDEKLLAMMAANMPGVTFVLDVQGVFRMSEGRGLAALGLQPGQVVGLSAFDVYHDIPAIGISIRRALAGEEVTDMVQVGAVVFDSRYIPLREEDGTVSGVLGIATDVTKYQVTRQQLQQSFERRGEQIQVSNEVAQQIASATNLEQLFERVVTLTKERFGYYHTQLLRYDPVQDAVVLVVGYGQTGAQMLALGHKLPMGSGLIGTAAATGETVMRPNLANDPDWRPNPLLPRTKGELAVPIKWQDEVLGVLDVQVENADALSDEDRLLLEGLCGQIAIAINSTRLLGDAALYRRVVEQAGQGVSIADLDGSLIFANQTLAELFGATKPMEIIGENINNFYPPEEQERLTQTVLPAVTQSGAWFGEISICSVTGENVVPTLNNVFLVRDIEGNPRYIANIVTDISRLRQAETELVQFRFAIEQSTDAILITDVDGKITYVNPSFEKIYGYTALEAIGQTPRILKSGLISQEQYVHFWDTLLGKGVVAGEIINKAKDGRLIPIESANTPILDLTGKIIGFMAVHRDITERKRAERTLRESESRLSDALKIARLGNWEYDFGTDTFTFNDNFYAVFRTTVEEVGSYQMKSDEYARRFVHPDDVALVGVEIGRAIEYTGPHYTTQLEHRAIFSGGEIGYIAVHINVERDETGKITRWYGANQDVTERRQTQEYIERLVEERTAQLRENQQLLQLIMDNIPQAVFWKNKDLVYMGANQAFVKDAGLNSANELTGKTDFDMPWVEQAELYRADDRQVIEDGTAKLNYEEPQTGPTNEITWLRTSKIPVRDEKKNVIAVLGMYEDITDRKRLEQQVQQSLVRRGRQVQLSTQIAQNIAASASLEDLYRQVVIDVKEQFGYYHVQLLRYEPTIDAVALVVGYGEIGKKMLVAGHKLPMGSGLIGVAAATGDTMLRPDLSDDLAWQPNPLLPDTKGEMAVPIKLREQVIGVLDVQSDRVGALGAEDQQLLEGLCGQIAVAIEQTRLRSEMEARLNEINTLYRTVSGQGWQAFQQSGEFKRSYHFDRLDVKPGETIWSDELDEVFKQARVVRTEVPKPITAAPLTVRGGNVVGALGVVEDPNRPLSPDERALVEQVSEQLALALDSARLFAQTQTALTETQILNEISVRLNAAVTLDDVLEATISYSVTMGASSAGIWLIESDEHGKPDTMEFMSSWAREGGPRLPLHTRLKLNQFPSSRVWLNDTGQPTFISNIQTDPRLDDALRATFAATGVQAVAFMPLVVGSRWLGVTIISWNDPHESSEREKIVFASIISQTVIKIENQQLLQRTQSALDETRRRTQEMAVLNEMGRTLTSLREVESIAEVIYQYTARLMEAETFFVGLYDDANQVISFPLLVDLGKRVNLPPQQLSGGLTDHIIRTKQPLLISEKFDESLEALGLENIELGEASETKSWLGVPMLYGDQVIGVISVQSPTKEGLYKEFDRDLLTTIASNAAISIENARIFQRTQRQAEYEALINTISQRIQGTTSVESALQVAVRELGRALGASRASVQLGVAKRKG